jgi:hypothetical protein
MMPAIDRLRLIHNREPKLIFVLSSLPLPLPVDLLISEDTIAKMVEFRDLLAGIESVGFEGAAPLTGSFLSETWPEVWESPKAGRKWLGEIFHSGINEFVKVWDEPPEPNSITSIRPGSSHASLKMFLIHQVLRTEGGVAPRPVPDRRDQSGGVVPLPLPGLKPTPDSGGSPEDRARKSLPLDPNRRASGSRGGKGIDRGCAPRPGACDLRRAGHGPAAGPGTTRLPSRFPVGQRRGG